MADLTPNDEYPSHETEHRRNVTIQDETNQGGNDDRESPLGGQNGEELGDYENDLTQPTISGDELRGGDEDEDEDLQLTQQPPTIPSAPIINAISNGNGVSFSIHYKNGDVFNLGRNPPKSEDPSVHAITIVDRERGGNDCMHVISRHHARLECKLSGIMIVCLGAHGIRITRLGRHFLLFPEASSEGPRGGSVSKIALSDGGVVQFGQLNVSSRTCDPYPGLEYRIAFPMEPIGIGRRTTKASKKAAAQLKAATAEAVAEEARAAVAPRDPSVSPLAAAAAEVVSEFMENITEAKSVRGVGALAGNMSAKLKATLGTAAAKNNKPAKKRREQQPYAARAEARSKRLAEGKERQGMGFQKKISKRGRLSAGTVKQKRKLKKQLTSQRSVTFEMTLNGGGASGNKGGGSSGSGGGFRTHKRRRS